MQRAAQKRHDSAHFRTPEETADSVLIAYCHPRIVHNDFMRSILGVLSTDPRIVGCIDAPGLYVPELRNALAARFLDMPADWLWFIDSDIVFPPDTLARMLAYAGRAGVLAGSYWSNYGGGMNTTWLERRPSGHYRPLQALQATALGTPELPGEPIELDACGMGMTLIHRQVLQDVAADQARDDPWKWFGHDLQEGVRLGEDVTFCERARRAGHTVLGVPVAVHHWKWALLGPTLQNTLPDALMVAGQGGGG